MISPTQHHLEWPVAGLECKSGADNVMDRYFGVFSRSFPQLLVFESPVFALWNPKSPRPPICTNSLGELEVESKARKGELGRDFFLSFTLAPHFPF